LAPKKENRKMVDMLERMGMIKKVDDDPDAAVSEESAAASSSAASPSAAVDVKSAPARQASAKTRASAPKASSSRSARKSTASSPAKPAAPAPAKTEPAKPAAAKPAAPKPAVPAVTKPPAPKPAAPAAPVAATVSAPPVTPAAPATVPPPTAPVAPAAQPAVPPPTVAAPPPVAPAPPVYTPPAAYQPQPVAPPVPPPAPFVQRPPESPAYRAAYISPEAEKNLYAHLSVSNSYSFGRPVPFENAPGAPGSSLADSFWADTPAVDSTVDRYLDTTELYTNFRMRLSGIDTIYLIEDYMKTLPDSLPAELRRSIIIRIVASSGFDFEKLVNDGIDRVTRLNEYATQFAARTDEVVTRQNAAIEDLERQITAIRTEIDERKNLHKRQFLTIEDEAQRLKEILDFITK
jgi:hypothetical protein